MSTQSMIGCEREGRVTAIYCHFDGYPEHHLPMLVKYWSGQPKVAALLEMGDLEKLGPVCAPLEDGRPLRQYRDRSEFALRGFDEGARFLYLWDGTGWLTYRKGDSAFHRPDPRPYLELLETREKFVEVIDELARRATDPEWGKKAVLIEEHDEERIAWMLGYLRKNVGNLATVWLEREAREACEGA